MAKSYIAQLDGKTVGTRTTKNRTYTHAIIGEYDIEQHRARAGRGASKADFDYYTGVVAGNFPQHNPTPERIETYRQQIEGGFDAFRARCRAHDLAHIEEQLAAGHYKVFTIAWAGRPDLAQKEAAKLAGNPWACYKNVQIVPAIEVVKASAEQVPA